MNKIKKLYIDEIQDLLNDSYLYFKKILWYYGDTICSVCNPKDVDDFIFDDDKITFRMN